MQKNEGRKSLMVNVLKLETGHIHGVLTLVIAEKNAAYGSTLSFSHISLG